MSKVICRSLFGFACILGLLSPDAEAGVQLSGATINSSQSIAQEDSTHDAAASPPAPLQQTEPTAQIIKGDDVYSQANEKKVFKRSKTEASDQGDITLNFINADVKDVAKAILGDYLKLNYEIGANVQGTVTIQTSKPLSRAQVIPVFQQVLELNGMALVASNGVYKIVALPDAHGLSGPALMDGHGSRSLGYGVEIIPVHYIGAVAMEKLLEPLAPQQGIIHIDAAHNILIVEGTPDERQTLRDDVALFDTDWLSGMSYALFTPSYTDAEELTKELNQIMGGSGSPMAGVVKLVPIDRLNVVLAITPTAHYLDQLQAWVARLDQPGQGTDRRVYIYRVRNGRATDIAETLSKSLFGNSGNGANQPRIVHQQGQENPFTPAASEVTQANQNVPGGALPEQSGGAGSAVSGIGSVSITPDETNNALVIVATPAEYATLQAPLRELDVKPMQVFIEAAIAEVTLNHNLQYGVDYFFQPDGSNQLTFSSTSSSALAQTFPGFSYMFAPSTNIHVILNALSGETHVEVLSAPKLLVLNNQTATLQVGDRVPIATEQAIGVTTASPAIVNSIQYQDTGVILKVTPRVNLGGLVLLNISQEVSQVANTTSSTIDSPTIQQRKIDSTVAIQDGQTIALGGLITDSKQISNSGLPLLQDIPLIGSLFGSNNNSHDRTELVVLLTPHVISDNDQAKAVTDELRHKFPALQPVFDKAN